ncbi:MAG: hypothetical protein AAGD86_09815 [Pseudomonadota bacterium]
MAENLLLALVTALLSSVLTLGAAVLFYQRVLARRVDERLEAIAVDFTARLESTAKDLGPALEVHVRDGVREALISFARPQSVAETTRTVTRTGAGLVEEGLNTLFGRPRKPGGRG